MRAVAIVQQPDAILLGLAHAENPAAANGDAGLADVRDRLQTVFVDARRDDAAVELGRRIEIVVVGGEARLLEAHRLPLGEHAERAAHFEVESGDRAHHFEDAVEFGAVGNLPPRRAHAEARRAVGLRLLRRCKNLGGIEQVLPRDAGLVMRALWTVRAVFGAAARLDRKQPAELHFARRVKLPVSDLGPENQLRQRKLENVADIVAGPIVADFHWVVLSRASKIPKSRGFRR